MLRDRARRMRNDPTDAERNLWRLLRSRQLDGFKFRRQQPIGGYIADFACMQARLIVEYDGGQHLDSAYDAERDAWLARQGFRILRLSNIDVLANEEGVWLAIQRALGS